jgi:hypothetical protein
MSAFSARRPAVPRGVGAVVAMLSFVVVMAGCTAGEYEISECDRTATTLDTDVCNQLNTDPNDCMPYQCDRATGRCTRQPRDYDHDGDPDSRCTENHGTDCYDRDPKITGGPSGACSCQLTGKPCEAGIGACKRFGSFECQNNVASCPVKSAAPMDYQSDLFRDAVHSYTSEDWNCDGKVDHACCYRNSNGTDICNTCDEVKTELCTQDVTTVCTNYCAGFKNKTAECKAVVSKLFACDPTKCGSRVAVCTCMTGGLIGLDCLLQSGVEERVRCR